MPNCHNHAPAVCWHLDYGGHDDHDYLDLDAEHGGLDDDSSTGNDHSHHEHVFQPSSSSSSSSTGTSESSLEDQQDDVGVRLTEPPEPPPPPPQPVTIKDKTRLTPAPNRQTNKKEKVRSQPNAPQLSSRSPSSRAAASSSGDEEVLLNLFASTVGKAVTNSDDRQQHQEPLDDDDGTTTTYPSLTTATSDRCSQLALYSSSPGSSCSPADNLDDWKSPPDHLVQRECSNILDIVDKGDEALAFALDQLSGKLIEMTTVDVIAQNEQEIQTDARQSMKRQKQQKQNRDKQQQQVVCLKSLVPAAPTTSAPQSAPPPSQPNWSALPPMPPPTTLTETAPTERDLGGKAPFEHDPHCWNERVLALCVVYILPFTYKAGSQLPYMFFLLELVDTYDCNLKLAGVFLALTYVCRLTTLAYSIDSPRKSTIWGTVAALMGYIVMILTSSVEKLIPNANPSIPAVLFVFSNIIIGFGEINGALQIFVKQLYSGNTTEDTKTVSHHLTSQLTVMKVSTVIVNAVGGVIYDYLSITGVATLGAVILLLQLGGILAMVYLEKKSGRDMHVVRSKATTAAAAAKEAIEQAILQQSEQQQQRGTISGSAIAAAAAAAHGYHGTGSVSSSNDNSSNSYWVLDRSFDECGNCSLLTISPSMENSSNSDWVLDRSIGESGNCSFLSSIAMELATIEEFCEDSGDFNDSDRYSIRDVDDDEEQPPPQHLNGLSQVMQRGKDDPLLGNLESPPPSSNSYQDVGTVTSAGSTRMSPQPPGSPRVRTHESIPPVRADLARSGTFRISRRGNRSHSARTPEVIMGSFTNQDIPIGWIDYFVVFAVSFQSIITGFVFGTGTLLLFKEFGQSKSMVGFLFSCSAAMGVLSSVVPKNPACVKFMHEKLPSPHNFYFFLFCCTYMTLLTTIPYFSAYLVGFLTMNFSLGLFVSYLTELQGKISTTRNYQKLAPYGQMCRRLSGLGIVFASPILYDIMPRLPNIVGSCVAFLFTLAVYIGFEAAKIKSHDELAARLGQENVHRNGSILYVTTCPGRANRNRRIRFSEQIIMSSVLSGDRNSGDEQSSFLDDASTVEIQVNYARREAMIENNIS